MRGTRFSWWMLPQSVGAVRCDVKELGIDALTVATQKNLLAFYGLGFLFVRKALAESLIPAHLARYGVDMGAEAGETARTGGEDLPYAAGARRFDLGNYNYLGASAAAASLRLIASIGVPRIEAHLKALAARLANGLLALALPWREDHRATPGTHRGGR
jgi:cysteine desulfurase/selenocysteine lyase